MGNLKYDTVSSALQKRIERDRERGQGNPGACRDADAVRRDMERDRQSLWRPAFVRDAEKILHLPYYNRYADKTQVFSFYHNDDITRRALHVQLVSRIARNIGAVLGLNLDLIEAIALGHDIGHTPFGHAGERYLDELLFGAAGLHFAHNVQSVRVLDKIFCRNVSLQTLDGILCHNGELAVRELVPTGNRDFSEFDKNIERAYREGGSLPLFPATLEGCVVRICDMIAYLGKDRQDARTARIIDGKKRFKNDKIGSENAAIINNMTVDIIENSYGRSYIAMSARAFSDLTTAKDENYREIYKNSAVNEEYEKSIRPMFRRLYYRLLDDLQRRDTSSVIFKHHIDLISAQRKFYSTASYLAENAFLIVADFIASMTDDYFIALYERLFPDSEEKIEYRSYFEDME